jgi:hypothetical protein
VQTPLSDDSGSDFAEQLDTSAELSADSLEDSATFSEKELDIAFAELLTTTLELELTFAELDCTTDELDSSDDEDSSLTAAGEPSESPHAQSTSELAKTAAETKPKTNLRNFIKIQPRRSTRDSLLIYIKKRSLEKLRHRY